jgi:CubicO group peptidase (beta-lactamase class C family)
MRTLFFSAACALLLAWASPSSAVTVNGPVAEKLDAYLYALSEDGFAGAILVAIDGEVVLSKGYGWADRENRVPVSEDTIFTIGSITKQFTAAAILKLEMDGKLSVNDPITKYFDDVPPEKQGITIHHLLTHTSGLRSSFGGDRDEVTREQIVRLALDNRARWKPGERYNYSNTGYSLLGAIVEQVTGMSYDAYLKSVFFEPLGMHDTGYFLPDAAYARLAIGYDNGKRWGTIRDYPWDVDGPYWNLRANGGILSTVGDMYRWHLATLEPGVLDAAALEKYYTPHVPESPPDTSYYGYGWAIATTERGTKLVTHNGGNGVFFADFRRYLDDDVAIVYMSNTAQLISDLDARNLRRIVFGFDPLPDAE